MHSLVIVEYSWQNLALFGSSNNVLRQQGLSISFSTKLVHKNMTLKQLNTILFCLCCGLGIKQSQEHGEMWFKNGMRDIINKGWWEWAFWRLWIDSNNDGHWPLLCSYDKHVTSRYRRGACWRCNYSSRNSLWLYPVDTKRKGTPSLLLSFSPFNFSLLENWYS